MGPRSKPGALGPGRGPRARTPGPMPGPRARASDPGPPAPGPGFPSPGPGPRAPAPGPGPGSRAPGPGPREPLPLAPFPWSLGRRTSARRRFLAPLRALAGPAATSLRAPTYNDPSPRPDLATPHPVLSTLLRRRGFTRHRPMQESPPPPDHCAGCAGAPRVYPAPAADVAGLCAVAQQLVRNAGRGARPNRQSFAARGCSAGIEPSGTRARSYGQCRLSADAKIF